MLSFEDATDWYWAAPISLLKDLQAFFEEMEFELHAKAVEATDLYNFISYSRHVHLYNEQLRVLNMVLHCRNEGDETDG